MSTFRIESETKGRSEFFDGDQGKVALSDESARMDGIWWVEAVESALNLHPDQRDEKQESNSETKTFGNYACAHSQSNGGFRESSQSVDSKEDDPLRQKKGWPKFRLRSRKPSSNDKSKQNETSAPSPVSIPNTAIEHDSSIPASQLEVTTSSLQQFVFVHESSQHLIQDIHGHTVLHVLPGRIDLGYSATVYTLALSHYLESLFQVLATDVKLTVLLDVRAGRGWPNPPALQMVGFIRRVASDLCARYPNCLNKCLIFPLPRAATAIWNFVVKPYLDENLRNSMELVPGNSTGVDSPPPTEKLSAFLSTENVDHLERHRLSCFN